jgi:hemoglobin-like flavoprotein
MEGEALAQIDQNVAAEGYQMVQQLYQEGVQEANMGTALFNQIMQLNQQQSQGLSSSIANFAGALAGGTGGSGGSYKIVPQGNS